MQATFKPWLFMYDVGFYVGGESGIIKGDQ